MCAGAFLGFAAGLSLLGLGLQILLPRFSAHLERRHNNTSPIFKFAFTFGRRAQRCLSYHIESRLHIDELEANERRIPRESGQNLRSEVVTLHE